jgi:hypothetical protein
MARFRPFLLAGLAISLMMLGVGIAQARTPTPTPSPTAPPTVTPTALPEFAAFAGQPWVDAHVSTDPVTARIGDILCGTAIFITPPGSGPFYRVEVASEKTTPGCGREGATITFFVGERQAPQTAVWHAGESQRLNLIIGPPFAEFAVSGTGAERITPYVNGKECGYGGIVYSNEQEPGCGVEGSQVTFKRVDASENVTFMTGVWHAWDGVSDPLPITLISGSPGGIRVGNTGTGDASDGEGNAWGRLSILLGFAGLTGAAFGLALRRQAMTR